MSPARMAKLETAIRLVLAFNEAFNKHDVAGMLLLLTDDCVFEAAAPPPNGARCSGKPAISQFLQDLFAGSPQARIEIEEIFSFGFRCILRWRYDWVAGTGEKAFLQGVDIFKVRDGLICEKLSYVKG